MPPYNMAERSRSLFRPTHMLTHSPHVSVAWSVVFIHFPMSMPFVMNFSVCTGRPPWNDCLDRKRAP